MSPTTVCPKCGKKLTFPREEAGRSTACPHCAGMVQVPAAKIRPPAAAHGSHPTGSNAPIPAPSAPKVCPACGESLPQGKNQCPGCGAMYSSAKAAKRARLEDRHDGWAVERGIMGWGVVGGLLAIVAAVVWFVAGLAAGYIFFYPPVLFVIGLAAIGRSITSARTRQRLARRRMEREER